MVSSTAANFAAAMKRIIKDSLDGKGRLLVEAYLASGRRRQELLNLAIYFHSPIAPYVAFGVISRMLPVTLVVDIVAPFGSYCTGFFRYASSKIISRFSSAFMVM